MSYLPNADSAMAAGTNNETPGAADTSGARQQPMLTDDDLELSPEKRRRVCFAICTLMLHTTSMFSMMGESLYPCVPVRVSPVYVKMGESQEYKNLRTTKSCTKSQPKATESNRKQSQAAASCRCARCARTARCVREKVLLGTFSKVAKTRFEPMTRGSRPGVKPTGQPCWVLPLLLPVCYICPPDPRKSPYP